MGVFFGGGFENKFSAHRFPLTTICECGASKSGSGNTLGEKYKKERDGFASLAHKVLSYRVWD